MKASSVITSGVCVAAVIGLAIWLAVERQARLRLGEEHEALEQEFGGKPESEVSIRMMDQVMSLKSVRVLNREVQADDTVVVTAAFEDRTDTPTLKLLMKKIGNDWKLSGPGE